MECCHRVPIVPCPANALHVFSTAVSCPNQCNREIATDLHMSVRAPVCEKWCSIADPRGQRGVDGAGFDRRKVWQNSVCDRAPSAPSRAKWRFTPSKSAMWRRFTPLYCLPESVGAPPISATESDQHLMWRYRLGTKASHDTIGWNSPGSGERLANETIGVGDDE